MSGDISPEQHIADHTAWRALEPELREFLADRRATKDRWEKVRTQVVGGAILAAIGTVGSGLFFVGKVFIEAINKSGNGP